MTIKRCYPVLVGASVAVNQLCNGETVTVPNGRKYYLKKSGTESLGASTGTAITGLTSGSDMVIDLTQLLGTAIADYVYSLETATAGAGVAKLREWGFLRGYQAYNAGSIESVEVTEKKVVGFNQVDASTAKDNTYINSSGVESAQSEFMCTDYIPCLPSTIYYTNADVNARLYTVIFYDADKNYIDKASASNATFTTPSNACYMRANVIKAKMTVSELVINISNPDRNGEYEAYHSTSYPLGNDTLRGIFKLDSNNELYADGDVKTSDGVITRYYGTRAYQSGDESLADAITDGTTTVYKLTTPTTEQGDPFTSPQVCDPDGTEAFVTRNGVPVGHETKYQL